MGPPTSIAALKIVWIPAILSLVVTKQSLVLRDVGAFYLSIALHHLPLTQYSSKFGNCGVGPDFCAPAVCVAGCDFKSACDPGFGPKWAEKENCPLNVCCSKFVRIL